MLHQRIGRCGRIATTEATNHYQKFKQPIVCAHTHVAGLRVAPDGYTPLVNLGCATRGEWHKYVQEEQKGYPNFQRAAALFIGGRLRLLVDSPYVAQVG